jgi:hypothetical protein
MNDKTYVRNVAVTAMNILDGINADANWDQLQSVWEGNGGGFVEFCGLLADFAAESEDKLECMKPQGFPGVYDYEVSYVLGAQIRRHMLTNSTVPGREEVSRWLAVLIDDFFSQGNDK